MELTVNVLVGGTIQLGVTDELSRLLKHINGVPIVANAPSDEALEIAEKIEAGAFAELAAEAPKPKAEKKPKKEEKPAEAPETPAVEVVEPEVIDKPQHTLDQLKKFCSQRKAEGVNVTQIIKSIANVERFTQIPPDKIDLVYDAVEKAEKE